MSNSKFANQSESVMPQRLLLAIAEQMRFPLLQISHRAELMAMRSASEDIEQIRVLAGGGLQLLDGYSLSLQLLQSDNYSLASETVSVASVLYDADVQLERLAKLYGVQLELNIGGKYEPVLAHKKGLQTAIVGLASALIEALPAQSSASRTLQLASHRCRYGIVAGVYADIPTLSSETLRRGRRLKGLSRQPMVDVSHTGSAGIFVADAIFSAMKLKLQVSRHHRLYGLGVVLPPSTQLALV